MQDRLILWAAYCAHWCLPNDILVAYPLSPIRSQGSYLVKHYPCVDSTQILIPLPNLFLSGQALLKWVAVDDCILWSCIWRVCRGILLVLSGWLNMREGLGLNLGPDLRFSSGLGVNFELDFSQVPKSSGSNFGLEPNCSITRYKILYCG